MSDRQAVIRYLIENYYGGDPARVAAASDYTVAQINDWVSGKRTPQKFTIEYLIHCVFTPEFKIIEEFWEFEQGKPVKPQLAKMLEGHHENAGIYAFYDSSANLIYLGKAVKLLPEVYDAMNNRTVHISLPRGIKNRPEKRSEMIRYISAYDVGKSKLMDFPRHVESLMLRISKPILNKNIGNLAVAFKSPVES